MKRFVLAVIIPVLGFTESWAQTITLDHTQKDLGEIVLGNTISDVIHVTGTGLTDKISISTPVSGAIYLSSTEITAEEAATGYDLTVSVTPEDLETTSETLSFTCGEATATYTVTWTPKEEDPEPVYPEHTVISLPYEEAFDGKHYDGKSYLPIGWLSTGNAPFVTAALTDLEAVQGSYYMITGESTTARNERAYTPFFQMQAGETYHMSFYLYMPAIYISIIPNLNSMDITVGTEQDATMHTTIKEIRDEDISAWKQYTLDFTPQEDGEYCFSFFLNTETTNTGTVAVDLFKIWTDGDIFPPVADFCVRTWYDMFNSQTIATFANKPVRLSNTSLYADTYKWEVSGADIMTSTEENPEFLFNTSGDYNIRLTVTNQGGSDTCEKTISVNNMNQGTSMALLSPNDDDNETKFTKFGDVPVFDTDTCGYDFVSGFNHYYREFAERFEMSEHQQMKITSIMYWMTSYSRQPIVKNNPERNWPLKIVFYGEKAIGSNGSNGFTVDTDNVMGEFNTTVVDAFGSMGVGENNSKQAQISLSGADIRVKGNFYMAFQFDESLPLESGDSQVTRSYLGLGVERHANGETTLYCHPTSGPDGFTPDGSWCPVDQLDSDLKGLGLIVQLWCSITADDGTGIDYIVESNGTRTTIEKAEIYTLDGRKVSQKEMSHGNIYIVNGNKIVY